MRARLVAVFAVSMVAAATLVPSGSAAAAVKLDNGVGTPAALNNPQCDKTLERVKFVYQAWLPCVKPWKDGADNGGATTPGVTASTIKVVVRKPSDETTNTSRAPIKDRASGEFATVEDAAEDTLPVYEKVYEQWGRKFEVKVVEMSGSDEAAQRADAVSIIAMKPFAVIDLGARRRVRVRHRGTQDPVDQPDDRHQRTEHPAVAVSVDGGRGPRRERGARRRVRRQGAQRQAGGVRR